MVHVAKTVTRLAAALSTTYEWVGLDNYTDAVCNDGSPAGYYWSPSSMMGMPPTWLVYLAGGNWCFNKKDCKIRCPPEYLRNNLSWPGEGLCSSKRYPQTMDMQGVLSPSHPDSVVGMANKVFVMYCSSDGHMGNSHAFGLEFRGARIIEAVFQDLVQKRGMAREEGHTVILGGVSAGARGAMVNLDYVPEFVADAGGTTKGLQVYGLLDSPLWMDMPPMVKSGFYGFRHSCRSVRNFANVTRLGKRCAEAFPERQRFKCLMGEYRVAYLDTPFFMVASQFDSFQLMFNIGPEGTGGDDEKDYVSDFGNRTLSFVSQLNVTSIGLYSPSCFTHARSTTTEGWSVDGVEQYDENGEHHMIPMEDAFQEWIVDVREAQGSRTDESKGVSPRKWIDNCEGVACGPGCPLDPDPSAHAAPRSGRSLALTLSMSLLTTLFCAFL